MNNKGKYPFLYFYFFLKFMQKRKKTPYFPYYRFTKLEEKRSQNLGGEITDLFSLKVIIDPNKEKLGPVSGTKYILKSRFCIHDGLTLFSSSVLNLEDKNNLKSV